MDPIREQELERRLTEIVLRELDERVARYQEDIESDAHIWASSFIKNTSGEMMAFVIGHQPKNVHEFNFFEKKRSHDVQLTHIATSLGKDNHTLCLVCDRVVSARNQSAHCANWAELELRIMQCLRLFTRFPTLILNLRDQHLVLSNWQLFQQGFNLQNVVPTTSPPPSSSWGNNPQGQQARQPSRAVRS